MTTRNFLSASAVARLANLTTSEIWMLAIRGVLPAYHNGSKPPRFREDDVLDFLANRGRCTGRRPLAA